jgi:hypothetical protein
MPFLSHGGSGTNQQLNLSIVGLGKMGLLHAAIATSLSGANLTSVCEKDLLLSAFAKSYCRRALPSTETLRSWSQNDNLTPFSSLHLSTLTFLS